MLTNVEKLSPPKGIVYFKTLADFENWFDVESEKVNLEEGVNQTGPFLRPTAEPGEPPWSVKWLIFFKNTKYLRLNESYYRKSSRSGGGAYRAHFSFHYGNIPPRQRGSGSLKWNKEEQVDIRIDLDARFGPHIHFDGDDHIPQSRVAGLQIGDQTMFTFIDRIQQHRKSGAAIEEVFGFKVEPAE
jgi:hypothetical protein